MGFINSVDIEGILVSLDLLSDGIYLIIDRPPGNSNNIDFGSVRTLIEGSGIEDWDFSAVLKAIEATDHSVRMCVSAHTSLKQVDESAKVEISMDRYTATIVFSAPINGGRELSVSQIRDILAENKIQAGIDEEQLSKIFQNRKHDYIYTIAKGQEPRNGKDGNNEYFFNTGKISYKPKELEDGKIDYLNLDIFQVAHAGQLLAKVNPPLEGIDGFTVLGDVIKAQQGKQAVSPVGKYTVYDENEYTVCAEIDGQILFQNGKITISPVLEIQGNIDNTTGNVNFLGTVVIRKNVLSGFTVTATGNIEINGVVEGATISSEGDLIIRGGVQGMGKANLSAKGSINAKFMESANVVAGEDIVADSVLRCTVKCGGSLTLTGKRGQLVGGSAKVLNAVYANIIGSQVEASTEIQVGLDPDLFEAYQTKRAELARLKKELNQLTQIINTLAKQRASGTLTEPKKAVLVKSLQSKTHIKTKVTELYTELETIIPRLAKGTGIVKANKTVNPGVKITIGNAILYVKDKLEHCSFSNVDGEIRLGAY